MKNIAISVVALLFTFAVVNEVAAQKSAWTQYGGQNRSDSPVFSGSGRVAYGPYQVPYYGSGYYDYNYGGSNIPAPYYHRKPAYQNGAFGRGTYSQPFKTGPVFFSPAGSNIAFPTPMGYKPKGMR